MARVLHLKFRVGLRIHYEPLRWTLAPASRPPWSSTVVRTPTSWAVTRRKVFICSSPSRGADASGNVPLDATRTDLGPRPFGGHDRKDKRGGLILNLDRTPDQGRSRRRLPQTTLDRGVDAQECGVGGLRPTNFSVQTPD